MLADIDTIRYWCWEMATRVNLEPEWHGYCWEISNTLLELNNIISGVK